MSEVARTRLLAASHAVLALVLLLGVAYARRERPRQCDYAQYHAASHLARRGEVVRAWDDAALRAEIGGFLAADQEVGGLQWNYPPVFLLVALPFSFLPYPAATLVWFAATLAAFGAAARVAFRDPLATWFFLGFPAGLVNLSFGQNGLLTGALLTAGLGLLEARPLLAGALLAGLVYKPHLAVLLPLFLVVGRAWRGLAGMALGGVGLGLASLVAFGLEPWIVFLGKLKVVSAGLESGPMNLANMTTVFAAARFLGMETGPARLLQGAVGLGALLVALDLWRRGLGRAALAAAVLAGLLTTPWAFEYDLALLAPALVWLAGATPAPGRGGWALLGVAWTLPITNSLAARFLGIPLAPPVLLGLLGLAWTRRGGGR